MNFVIDLEEAAATTRLLPGCPECSYSYGLAVEGQDWEPTVLHHADCSLVPPPSPALVVLSGGKALLSIPGGAA